MVKTYYNFETLNKINMYYDLKALYRIIFLIYYNSINFNYYDSFYC